MYSATLHSGYELSPGGLTTGRSILSAGTTTRVDTRSLGTVGDGDGELEGSTDGGNVGLGDGDGVSTGVGAAVAGGGDAGTPASTGPVYDNSPTATSMTPLAVSREGTRRVRRRSRMVDIGRTA
jgi:hypothetical protein